ncbi:MAG: ABC transporter substrate-binding protein, partial [Treponema sp.]
FIILLSNLSYCPFTVSVHYMPGGSTAGYWNYENPRLDELGRKGQSGQYLKEEDYWAGNLEATTIGLKDAIRIYLCSTKDSFVANKARFNSRMLYGVGDGLNGWSIRSADVKPDTTGQFKGQKVLRVTQHSARGSLFMSSWDPVGRGGFTDSYSAVVTGATFLKENDEAPHTAEDIAFGFNIDFNNVQVSPKLLADGTVGGDVAVPANAVIFDTKAKEWKEVGAGVSVAVGATSSFIEDFYWHNGELITQIDDQYAVAFIRDWCTKDGDDDPYYDEALSANLSEELAITKGTVYHENCSMTFYRNFFFSPDMNRTILNAGTPSAKAGNPGRATVVPWEINEALAE